MKKILIFSFLIFKTNCFAQSKVNEEKIFSVPTVKPEINIGDLVPKIKKSSSDKRPDVYFVSLVVSDFSYKQKSLLSNSTSTNPSLFGFNLGRRFSNEVAYFKGNYEIGGEWQNFKRKSGGYSQKLNLFQLNLFQNLNLGSSNKKKVHFTGGLGLAPIYLMGEQSVIANAISDVGFMGTIKFNFIFHYLKNIDYDFCLKTSWGSVNGVEVSQNSLGLGINFE
jgi:hypothetical protein